jgi:maleylacetate reductase
MENSSFPSRTAESVQSRTSASGFVYTGNPVRVIFGFGALSSLPEEVDRLRLSRVLVLATPNQAGDADRLAQMLGGRAAAVFAGATMHTPKEVTERAMDVVANNRIDGLVAVGGGSTTGLSKAIAFRTDLPQIVSPTSYAGSEMTPILGETENARKVTRSHPSILPEVVIYDVDLTLSLPTSLSVVSGMNAIAHAVETLYACDRNPVTSLMAVNAISALARSLPVIALDNQNRTARYDALYGAWLCGTCLGTVSMALHHKLCHTLGGSFDLPHAETHTAVLPHVLAFNAVAAPEAARQIAQAIGADNAAMGLYDLASRLGATMALKNLGMPENGIEKAAALAMSNKYPNPRPLQRDAVRDIIAAAWSGRRPIC